MVKKDTLILLGIGGAVAGIIALTKTSAGQQIMGAGTEKVTQIRDYVTEGATTIIDRTKETFTTLYQEAKDLIPDMPTISGEGIGKWVYNSATGLWEWIKDKTPDLKLPDLDLGIKLEKLGYDIAEVGVETAGQVAGYTMLIGGGAGAGAVAGSVIPIVGTGIGAGVGAFIGLGTAMATSGGKDIGAVAIKMQEEVRKVPSWELLFRLVSPITATPLLWLRKKVKEKVIVEEVKEAGITTIEATAGTTKKITSSVLIQAERYAETMPFMARQLERYRRGEIALGG